ncbi:FAD-binding monooxygenase [Gymnopilus junonius]|uniref:FAD-binding monooxygenase n=1 Tax=Gymnopilus junonius TaxID=109634 RepID=A0A9P5TIY4_GYMJU|nr:FAD-binding monooxygenase [Gymnopilus junonius]
MSVLQEKSQVLVITAGPTGLTMALYLGKHGVDVRIIEKSSEEHGRAQGTAIHPRTQELLAIMGTEKDLFEITTNPLQMAIYGADGKIIIIKSFDWSEVAEDSPTIPFRKTAFVSQAQLEVILHCCQRKFGHEVEFGKQLADIVQDELKVTAKVTVLADRMEILVDHDYLVTVDGAKGSNKVIPTA